MLNFFRHFRRDRPLRRGKAATPTGRDFDRFTRRARRVLALAQEEAAHLGHNYMGTEHLLLGLIRESDGIAGQALAAQGVELSAVRAAVVRIVGQGKQKPAGEIRLTPRAKQIIGLAVDEAYRLHHDYLGTEHLLLGLVREGEGVGVRVLRDLGVAPAAGREVVLTLLARGRRPSM